jgi:hypothetical protein
MVFIRQVKFFRAERFGFFGNIVPLFVSIPAQKRGISSSIGAKELDFCFFVIIQKAVIIEPFVMKNF